LLALAHIDCCVDYVFILIVLAPSAECENAAKVNSFPYFRGVPDPAVYLTSFSFRTVVITKSLYGLFPVALMFIIIFAVVGSVQAATLVLTGNDLSNITDGTRQNAIEITGSVSGGNFSEIRITAYCLLPTIFCSFGIRCLHPFRPHQIEIPEGQVTHDDDMIDQGGLVKLRRGFF
jgi:hypothetical protein